MMGMVQFRFEKVRNVVMCDKLKNFGKIFKNIYGPVISNSGRFSFLKRETIAVCFHKLGKVF
jgi:hypothetical protein